ncbi:hypothetical protein HDU91_006924 [Kappamyces sp. JEL0680]|nr:hypothetical protein HDU91_006924 [Kappamyces sp. JEL0680]
MHDFGKANEADDFSELLSSLDFKFDSIEYSQPSSALAQKPSPPPHDDQRPEAKRHSTHSLSGTSIQRKPVPKVPSLLKMASNNSLNELLQSHSGSSLRDRKSDALPAIPVSNSQETLTDAESILENFASLPRNLPGTVAPPSDHAVQLKSKMPAKEAAADEVRLGHITSRTPLSWTLPSF